MNSPRQAFLADWIAKDGPDQPAFSSPEQGIRAASNDTIITPLDHLGLIRISGEDAKDFLHKLGSNDVLGMSPDRALHNSLNSPKGRVLASFVVWQAESELMLMLSADLLSPIARKLSMYVLRAKAKVSEASDRVLIGLAGPEAARMLEPLGLYRPEAMSVCAQDETRVLHLDGNRFVIEAPAERAGHLGAELVASGATPAHTAAWRWLDIQAGLPLITATLQDEFVAQMINFELIGGVNFKKGCYPGQEIVARTQYLGKLKKRMFRAHASHTSVQIGMDIFAPEFGEQSCGKVVAAEPGPDGGTDLLAVMQISAFEAGIAHLGASDGPLLELGTLPYTID